jgi:UDP-N-acetylmuramoylalanine--D-glutamate ligase
MKDYRAYFKDKKITVMGLGLLGRGVGDAAFMAECGAKLTITDLKSKEALGTSLEKLSKYTSITYTLGEHRMEDFENCDLVLVAAGVPLDSLYVLHAKASGVRIAQSAALFAELSEIPIIGVTGTRGKTTVTHMIHHALGEVTGEKAILGGNVRGVSNLQLLTEVTGDSLAVFELDSWQLQGFGWAGISPQISVFTNFMEDHLNYYMKGGVSHEEGMDAYFADKAQIFEHQGDGATLVTTPEVFARAGTYMEGKGKTLLQDVILVDDSTLPEEFLLRVPGEHNRLNAALALEALKATGLTEDEALLGLSTFAGVEGRLQYLGDINGVRVYNDNNATTPAATIAGLRAVGNGKNVVLIIGGDEKNLDMNELLEEIPKWCSKVVLFKERGTDRIRDEVFAMEDKGVKVYEEEGLPATVNRALEVAESGGVILYSPAFSSFGKYFKNEYDRGDQFVNLINKLS